MMRKVLSAEVPGVHFDLLLCSAWTFLWHDPFLAVLTQGRDLVFGVWEYQLVPVLKPHPAL